MTTLSKANGRFVEQFPECRDSLVMAIISKIIKKERGVGLFGE